MVCNSYRILSNRSYLPGIRSTAGCQKHKNGNQQTHHFTKIHWLSGTHYSPCLLVRLQVGRRTYVNRTRYPPSAARCAASGRPPGGYLSWLLFSFHLQTGTRTKPGVKRGRRTGQASQDPAGGHYAKQNLNRLRLATSLAYFDKLSTSPATRYFPCTCVRAPLPSAASFTKNRISNAV